MAALKIKPHKSSPGFTLIELLLVIAIVSIIGALSTVFYSRFLLQNSVANISDQIAGQLRKAQIYSMTGKQNGPWGVKYISNEIILFQGATYALRNPIFDEEFSVNPNTSVTGVTEVVFAKTTGLPSATGTITVSGGSNTDALTINAQGGVSR